MSVIDTLITDRTQADVDRARELTKKLNAGTATVEELAEWNIVALKGCYDYADLNRVSEAIQYLDAMLKRNGYISKVMWKAAGRMPDGFAELEFIQSNGAQYIDTGFKPNQDTRVVFDFYPVSTTNTHFFGSRTSSSANNRFLTIHAGDLGAIRDDFGSQNTNTKIVPSERTVIDKNKNVTDINGKMFIHTSATFTGLPIYLFASNNGGTASNMTSIKLYSCQIYDNGTLARDFVPCVNVSGEAGLYDLVGEKFYGNSGTGAFSVGPETDTSDSSPNVWTEQNAFTPAYAEKYLTNIDRLRSVLTLYETTPKVPDDTENLTVEEANAIEQILVDLESTIKTMLKTRVACGDAYCGGEYL